MARDKYIIRQLESSIVEDMKKQLVQLDDIRERKAVCLTPCDARTGRLLKKHPETWDEIKNGQSLIINGQHCIVASKEL